MARIRSLFPRLWEALLSRHGYRLPFTALAIAIGLTYLFFWLHLPIWVGVFFRLMYVVVLLIAACCGYGPGIAVTLLMLVVAPFIFPPAHSLRQTNWGAVAGTLGFSVLISNLSGGRRSAIQAAEHGIRRLNLELEGQRGRLDTIIASVPGIVWERWTVPDLAAGRINFVSEHIETMLGYTVADWLAIPDFWLSIVHPDDRAQAAADAASVLTEGHRRTYEYRWIAHDGTTVWVQTDAVPIMSGNGDAVGLRGVTINVTERRKLEEQLRQSQKMDAVGQLAGGMAHDFNNLLTVMNGFSDLLMDQLPDASPLRDDVRQIKMAGDRAAALTRQLLAFSRKQVLRPTQLNLNTIIQDLEKMLPRLIGEDILLRTALMPGNAMVKADQGQIEQVIINLVVNARDAMPRGGSVTLETSTMDLDEDYARRHLKTQPGPYVMLAVTDTGIGMDAETKARIFEPFFTTKEVGKGTGLGLSTVLGIVQQSGGNLWVYSEPGRGTTFKIYLPLVENGQQHLQPEAPERAPSGTETILLTEDDEMVRALASRVLTGHGYRVIEASDGRAALKVCEQNTEPIHLLVTDMVMPGMNGRELADLVMLSRPKIKVLYMSGYTDNAIVHQQVLDDDAPFIQKPFAPAALLRKIREVMGRSATASST